MSQEQAPLLAVEEVSCGYGARAVASQISFSLDQGDILCLLGPNGVGKTTLFKAILRLLPLRQGRIRIHGQDVAAWPRRRFAAKVAYVPQAHTPPFPFLVRDVVVMGRISRVDLFGAPSAQDGQAVQQALDKLGIGHLAQNPYTQLSGGERQLVLIARALAQEPEILIMDEPTANLDFGNQLAVLEHVRGLARGGGLGVLMTTHDPNHALVYGSKVAAMGRKGSFVAGTPSQVVTPEYLRRTYGVAAHLIRLQARDGQAAACLPQAWGVPLPPAGPELAGGGPLET